MPFESLLGNEAAIGRLRGILARGCPSHAYLFSGPDGVGKKTAALEFACALGAAPRLVAVQEGKHEISIAQIHEIIRELGFASIDRRAFVIDDAHRMSPEAMNALLKTLEEPPHHTVIIIVSGVPHLLPDTIRSRCQTIRFFPLPDEYILRHALERLGLPDDEARIVTLLADGSIGAASALSAEIGEIAAEARELQERVITGELNPLIEALGKIRDTDESRRRAKRQLSLLAACLREALRASTGQRPSLATDAFLRHMSRLETEDLIDRMELLVDHQRLIDLNANVGLVVEDALLRL